MMSKSVSSFIKATKLTSKDGGGGPGGGGLGV